jgi:hypothetical protein
VSAEAGEFSAGAGSLGLATVAGALLHLLLFDSTTRLLKVKFLIFPELSKRPGDDSPIGRTSYCLEDDLVTLKGFALEVSEGGSVRSELDSELFLGSVASDERKTCLVEVKVHLLACRLTVFTSNLDEAVASFADRTTTEVDFDDAVFHHEVLLLWIGWSESPLLRSKTYEFYRIVCSSTEN